MVIRSVFVILTVILLFSGYYFGRIVTLPSQIKLIELLISFSSIVFAVVGVWLAVVFPNVMTGVYKNTSVDEKQTLIDSAKRLLIPLFLASFISASSFIIRLLIEPLRGMSWVTEGEWANGVLFSFISIASFAIVISLILALAPGLQLLFDGISVVKGDSRRNRYLSRVSRTKKDS
ncbi:MAG TPA: hypothetical protein ENJ28_11630 [Gammaproteobacteria bacterium]|nr:hypothetical protein [Gammaproteobacteria bacterium]